MCTYVSLCVSICVYLSMYVHVILYLDPVSYWEEISLSHLLVWNSKDDTFKKNISFYFLFLFHHGSMSWMNFISFTISTVSYSFSYLYFSPCSEHFVEFLIPTLHVIIRLCEGSHFYGISCLFLGCLFSNIFTNECIGSHFPSAFSFYYFISLNISFFLSIFRIASSTRITWLHAHIKTAALWKDARNFPTRTRSTNFGSVK